jgi:hypothetical protein
LYSEKFIEDLLKNNKDTLKLIDNYILFSGQKIYFPEDLQLNKDYVFKGIKENLSFNLKVKRINETTLDYVFNLYKGDSLLLNDKGETIIGTFFFYAPESDEDGEYSYSSYEYRNSTNDFVFCIRIGKGKDEQDRLRAKVKFEFADQSKIKVRLSECPVLREEKNAL